MDMQLYDLNILLIQTFSLESVIKHVFLISQTKICVVCTQNGSFEDLKQIFYLINKKIFTILRFKIIYLNEPIICIYSYLTASENSAKSKKYN